MEISEIQGEILQQIRRDTEALPRLIHLNNAGSSLMPSQVFDTIQNYQELENRIGGYEAAEDKSSELDATYQSAARLIGSQSEEIAFLENATVAWNMAFHSIDFKPGDEILSSTAEYASNFIVFLQAKKRYGIEIKVVPDIEGQIDLEALEKSISSKTKLIAITHIPTNGGLVNPAEEVGKVASKHGILYLLDACQSVGQYPIDVKKIGCHFLSATGRKYLRGPRGTGFLFVKKELLPHVEPFFLDLKGATWYEAERYKVLGNARKFENWERNIALQLGLGEAFNYANKLGIKAIWKRTKMLAAYLRTGLEEIDGIQVKDRGKELCGIVSIELKHAEADSIKSRLRENNINVSLITPNSTLLDSLSRDLKPMIRASVHYFNTTQELDHFTELLNKMLIKED